MLIRLSENARLYHADCRDAIRELPDNSIDSVVTDPPYALVSIVKRFGGANAAPTKGNDAYMRASAGFMGKQWDTGEVAFSEDFWADVLRVLKPGGHVAAFGASRGYHRMACAIEDAGFEIRGSLMWVYGTGFPKSHDVSKGIDKRGGKQVSWFGPWLKQWRKQNNIKQSDVAALFPSKTGGKTGCVANWELGFNLPTPEQFNLICTTFGLPFDSLEAAEREVIGQRDTGIGTGGGSVAIMGDSDNRDITTPATDAARQWEGWGTALKPAFEPIVLARKPLSEGTVAANVLRWGTGALNIDGCRMPTSEDTSRQSGVNGGVYGRDDRANIRGGSELGRWPANVVTDGSDEVVGAFPSTAGQLAPISTKPGTKTSNVYGKMNREGEASADRRYTEHGNTNFAPLPGQRREPVSSAARFFYSAKAGKADRNGSKHPTVKPIALMEWLATLITPPGGTILDPFAGSGTTGAAARNKGFRCILVEREDEYVADIRRRLSDGPNPLARLLTWNRAVAAYRAQAVA